MAAAGTSNCGPPPVDDDVIGDGMQCTNHPYRNNAASSTGGICAFCLQEKLGKLVSSSSSSFFNAASSSPSFRSDPANAASLSLTLALRPAAPSSSSNARHGENQGYGYSSTNQSSTARRARIPFLLPHKKKKPVPDYSPSNLVLKRSKSAVAPRRCTSNGEDYGSGNRKRGGFWSFLYHSKTKQEKTSSSSSSSARDLKPAYAPPPPPPPVQAPPSRKQQRAEYVVVVDESVDSPYTGSSNPMSFGGKVSRSRSVGCGSRSFSGDFFEKLSTGFGDCTLRRVESQREGRRCSSSDVIQEKVRCAGIFGGFMMTSSSYWLSEGEEQHVNGKESAAHGRSRSWGWALASPMRALTKPSPSSSSSTRDLKSASKSNATTPNLAAIPSLLTVRG